MMPSGVEHYSSPYMSPEFIVALPSMMPSGVEHADDFLAELAKLPERATFYDAFGR